MGLGLEAMDTIPASTTLSVNKLIHSCNENNVKICTCEAHDKCNFFIDHAHASKISHFLKKCKLVSLEEFFAFSNTCQFKDYFAQLVSNRWNCNVQLDEQGRAQALVYISKLKQHATLKKLIMLAYAFEALYSHYESKTCTVLGKGNRNSTMCSYCCDIYNAATSSKSNDRDSILRGLKDLYVKSFCFMLLQKTLGNGEILHTPGLLKFAKVMVRALCNTFLSSEENNLDTKQKISKLMSMMQNDTWQSKIIQKKISVPYNSG